MWVEPVILLGGKIVLLMKEGKWLEAAALRKKFNKMLKTYEKAC